MKAILLNTILLLALNTITPKQRCLESISSENYECNNEDSTIKEILVNQEFLDNLNNPNGNTSCEKSKDHTYQEINIDTLKWKNLLGCWKLSSRTNNINRFEKCTEGNKENIVFYFHESLKFEEISYKIDCDNVTKIPTNKTGSYTIETDSILKIQYLSGISELYGIQELNKATLELVLKLTIFE